MKRKVAIYARVSTDSEEQLTSYSSQIKHYSKMIKSNSEWEFVGVYADEGISGTQVKHRAEFQRMINDALSGKIDIIIMDLGLPEIDGITAIKNIKDLYKDMKFVVLTSHNDKKDVLNHKERFEEKDCQTGLSKCFDYLSKNVNLIDLKSYNE